MVPVALLQGVSRVLALALAGSVGIFAGCSSSPPDEPQPGTTAPGGACGAATDCYCWACTCEGVSGAPGAAQLCLEGVCPSGTEACTPVCALANASVASAASVDSCVGRP